MITNGKHSPARARSVLAVALACSLASSAPAIAGGKGGAQKPPPTPTPSGWEVIILHPAGDYTSSSASGVSGTRQVGCVVSNAGDRHASLWNGTAESWVDLHPAGALSSGASGIGDGQVVGEVDSRAGLWTWTGESWGWVDLHPFDPAWTRSGASGVSDGQQVGFVERDGRFVDPYNLCPYNICVGHASLWGGTPESRVDLHPSGWTVSSTDAAWPMPLGYTGSRAYAVSGGQQVGFVEKHELDSDPYTAWHQWFDYCHASMWSGTSESWVDLHPRKSSGSSCAYDVSDGQQVGYATIGGRHAGMWSGRPQSWVDLHPSGYLGSEARCVSHGYQAGIAWSSYQPGWFVDYVFSHAGVWRGTPESWVDLHDLLPAGYEISEALDIEATSTDVWVVGRASTSDALPPSWNPSHAVLWHASLPE
jgi:hypothetical protein